MRPLILTNAFRRPRGTRLSSGVKVSEDTNVYACVEEMVDVIVHVLGASPLLLPTLHDEETVAALLEHVDGILLPGAVSNIHPKNYGEAPDASPQIFDEAHDRLDIFLIRKAREMGIPFLGICRAMQAMNVAFGGSLQHGISSQKIDHLCSDPCDGHEDAPAFMHAIKLAPNGLLSRILGDGLHVVNSLHEQALATLGEGLNVEARAEDGIIEAISIPHASAFFLGVQWHPEALYSHPVSQKIFSAFKTDVERRHNKRNR